MSEEIGTGSFEERLKALEDAVRILEAGEEPLERSLELYERVVGHLKACHELLAKAERRVKILVETPDGELLERDFCEEGPGEGARG